MSQQSLTPEAMDRMIRQVEPQWTDIVPSIVFVVVLLAILAWLTRMFRRSTRTANNCLDVAQLQLDQAAQTIELSRESNELMRKSIEAQAENNRVMNELITSINAIRPR